jgi:pimeloyl-ACP methyl ester carboxylesterase
MRPRSVVVRVIATVVVLAAGALAAYTGAETRRAERTYPGIGRRIVADDATLRYREQGTGAPVVLLHGNPGFLEDFAPDDTAGVFLTLARTNRVIALDRPGHGYSSRPSLQGTTPGEQARLLHDALRRLGVERPILVGHSWGGGLALVYALQYPTEVRGLVLIGTRAFRDTGRADPIYAANRIAGIGALLRATVMLPVGRAIVRRRLSAAYAPAEVEPGHLARARALWLRPSQVAATVWDTQNLQEALGAASPHYGAIDLPVSILVGDHDRGLAESRALATRLPNAQLTVVASTGHELVLTRPAAVVDAVRRVAAVLTGTRLSQHSERRAMRVRASPSLVTRDAHCRSRRRTVGTLRGECSARGAP